LSLVALLVGVGLLVAAGLAGPADSGSTAKKGGTLRLAGPSDVDSVDPALSYIAWTLEFATCAKLFNYPDAAGAAATQVIREVVDTFTVSKDGRTYTFDLEKSFRFQTGAAVTAQSFADAFNRDANPKMKSPATNFMHEIVGADAVIAGKAKAIAGVRVLSRYRLQLRLTKPAGDLPARLATPFFCPILPGTPIDPAGIDDPAGSGPYYVSERVFNRQVTLERNPYYRGRRPANADRIVYTAGESPEACLSDTEQDRIDYCVVPTAAYPQLADKYGINKKNGQFFVSPGLSTRYFAFNHDRPAFKGPGQIPLEKAINYAIDRPALVRPFGYLGGRRTDQMLPTVLGRDESIYPLKGADPKTATKWLARAKLKPPTLVLYTFNRAQGIAVAQVFAFDLKQIGIDVDVKYFDPFTLAEKAGTRGEPFDVVMSGWAADFPDGASFFALLNGDYLGPTGNFNLAYLDDPVVNARIDAANRLTGDPRRQAWADLDVDLMRNDPPWAPFLNGTSRDFVSRSFGCFVYNPAMGVDVAAACKK
jgi:peptide/nickel transport system substrate-binding protein